MDLKGSLASRSAQEPYEARRDLTSTLELRRRREGLRGPEMAAGELGMLLRSWGGGGRIQAPSCTLISGISWG
jgi:hypothetical protein